MNSMAGHEDERRMMDRRMGERRSSTERRQNSAFRVPSDDMVFKSGRRADERRKFDRRDATA